MPKTPHTTGNAHYTVHIPTHDTQGNRLQDLSLMGQQLQSKIPRLIHSIHSEGPFETHPYRHLKILAVDTPETDLHVKQLAAQVGEQANHPSVFMHKDSQQGVHPWTIPNRSFDGGPGRALEGSVAPYAATVAPNTAY